MPDGILSHFRISNSDFLQPALDNTIDELETHEGSDFERLIPVPRDEIASSSFIHDPAEFSEQSEHFINAIVMVFHSDWPIQIEVVAFDSEDVADQLSRFNNGGNEGDIRGLSNDFRRRSLRHLLSGAGAHQEPPQNRGENQGHEISGRLLRSQLAIQKPTTRVPANRLDPATVV